jgi:CheY-like chemotaxis protein
VEEAMGTSSAARHAGERKLVKLDADQIAAKLKRALIIDDEVDDARRIAEALLDTGGFVCTIVGSLADAAQTLSSARFPLVICDNIFEDRPSEKGSEFIRDQPKLLGDALVILLTGYPRRQIVDVDLLENSRGVRIVKKGLDVVEELTKLCEQGVQERAARFSRKLEDVIEMFLVDMNHETDIEDLLPGPRILRRARIYLLDYLKRLPRQEQGQFYIAGRVLSPQELTKEVEAASEVGVQLLDMVLDDLFDPDYGN